MRTPSEIFRIATLSSVLICSALICAAPPLAAQTIIDPKFGLSVTPPTGYVAALWTPMPSRNVIIVVQRKEIENAGCIVEFLNSDTTGSDTQDDVNARTDNIETIERLRAEFSARYNIQSIGPIEHAGVRGAAIVGDRRFSDPMSASSIQKNVREWYVILDTIKGRTTVNCETYRYDFNSRLPDFDAVVRSIAFPK
jgi:hypothetical protein